MLVKLINTNTHTHTRWAGVVFHTGVWYREGCEATGFSTQTLEGVYTCQSAVGGVVVVGCVVVVWLVVFQNRFCVCLHTMSMNESILTCDHKKACVARRWQHTHDGALGLCVCDDEREGVCAADAAAAAAAVSLLMLLTVSGVEAASLLLERLHLLTARL